MYRILNGKSTIPKIPESTQEVFLDIETKSGDPKRGALKPYHGDVIAGFSVTWDDCEDIYYFPMNHQSEESLLFAKDDSDLNVPEEKVLKFLRELLGKTGIRWINHNIKFDAHFIAQLGVEIKADLIDTLTLSKLADSQKSPRYGMKVLQEKWLGIYPEEADEVQSELRRMGSKDYGDVSVDILGRYACSDVNINRQLWRFIVREKSTSPEVWEMEERLTKTLFNIERRGLRINQEALKKVRIQTQTEIAELETQIFEESVGICRYELDPMSNASMANFFFSHNRLPVYNRTANGNPSADSASMNSWLEDESLSKYHPLIKAILNHRGKRQLLSLYIDGWTDLMDDRGVMRPSYNQTVATGRMSSYSPNIQQLNSEAKKLVVPSPGNEFLSLDYSQIEFRILSVVIGDRKMQEAYRENPETDFHDYASQLCQISRREAKVVNFGIAFGMGQRLLERNLKAMKSEGMHPSQVLLTYRSKFPRIFSTSERLMSQAQATGYAKTLYGRRRSLDVEGARKALNSVVQGTAADIVKEVATNLDRDPVLKDQGVTIRAIVHDEFLFEAPAGAFTEKIVDRIRTIMQTNSIDLPVPLLVDGGKSSQSWKDCT